MGVVGTGRTARLGSGQNGKAWIYNGTDAITPKSQILMRPGFASVSDMLAKRGHTWAHRGGSGSYPEMSLHGYTQCVAMGWGVLEVPLARTVDGVWFGIHDSTLDRTSQITNGQDVRKMTWAEITKFQNVLRSNGIPRPYMRWEEVIEAYGPTHILVNDIKSGLYNATARNEYFGIMADSGGPKKHVVKWGGGDLTIAKPARDLGYESWGYFYQSEMSSPDIITKMKAWSIIGMEYDAPQATFDRIKDLGQPIVAHIAPNQAAYNMAKTAITAGGWNLPWGVQCSGVQAIAPVSSWN